LLEYDDVINRHREVIYGKRRAILETFVREKEGVEVEASLRQTILEMVEAEIEQIISFHTNAEDRSDWNMKEVAETVATIFPVAEAEQAKVLNLGGRGADKFDAVAERTRLVEYIVELAQEKYDDLLVKKVPAKEMLLEIEKQVLLRSIDTLWVEHLVAIDHLRTGIGLQGYGQRDPLVEYKKETYRMFNELLSLIQKEVVYTIYKISLGITLAPSVMEQNKLLYQGAEKTAGDAIAAPSAADPKFGGKMVGRNDHCPCGSGKKFKKCHGQ